MTTVVTSGEPAGIGPDILLKLASQGQLGALVLGDINVFTERAKILNIDISVQEYQGGAIQPQNGRIIIQHIKAKRAVVAGQPDPENAEYVLSQIDAAVAGCLTKNYSSMVTAPVCKATICESGMPFSGHTEYIAALTNTSHVVMMLACEQMRVALVTTHLPLSQVPSSITDSKIKLTIQTVLDALKYQFGLSTPKIMVAGLNPHAGEGGYLGREEIDIIQPALQNFDARMVQGPFAADTMFSSTNVGRTDAFVAMYHDQGLAVLKYAGFGKAVNITLGLPIIRTSVDHGTAFSLAGTGMANPSSLLYAIEQASHMQNQKANTELSLF